MCLVVLAVLVGVVIVVLLVAEIEQCLILDNSWLLTQYTPSAFPADCHCCRRPVVRAYNENDIDDDEDDDELDGAVAIPTSKIPNDLVGWWVSALMMGVKIIMMMMSMMMVMVFDLVL